MLNSKAEFDSRRNEVDEYLAHLLAMNMQVGGASATLMNTMKSSALLMIYNIVESTMTNLIQDIFDHLQSQNVTFDSLTDNMKELVLGYAKKSSPKAMVARINTPLGLVAACFDRTTAFSGNLDSKVIRETLKNIGVRAQSTYSEESLLTVKTERNHLAHGNKSFSACGRDYTVNQLLDFQKKTCLVLDKVILDITRFLNTRAYC